LNADRIFRLEKELGAIRDAELSAKINEIKLFEHLHNEKPSPLFLSLIMCSNNDDLSCIRGERGETLHTKAQRENRLVKYFSDVYSKKKGYSD
jgi:hypothetical protein